MDRTTERTSAARFASCRDWHRLGLHTPEAEPFELLESLDSVITLRVGHPLTLVQAVDMQERVKALIARRPAAIVLDVAGVMPIDEMGMLMLSTVARDAADSEIALALANPSAPLRDRLAQLGVRNLTFVDSRAPTTPTEDEYEQVTGRRPASLPPPGPEASTGLTRSGRPLAHTGAGSMCLSRSTS